MRYAKLSCTEFYPCYLQQCHSIDLFSYRTPGHGQKGHMNKVCPSFCSEVFMELALQFFSGTQHGVRGPCGVVYDRKKCFIPKMGKIGQVQGSLNVQENYFFSQLFAFLSVWSAQCAPSFRVSHSEGGRGGRPPASYDFLQTPPLIKTNGPHVGCNPYIKTKLPI